MTFSDGAKHVGNYKNGVKNGYGTETFSDGKKYVGNFKDDVRSGYGTYTWTDGSKYVGEWKDNYANGYGTYTNTHGIEFSGNWVNDELNGKSLSDLDKLTENNNNNNNNNNQNTTTCDQPQKPLYKYKDDKMYEYAKSGDCWWAQNVKSKKWFNLTELVKTRPNMQVSIDRLNTAETNNELIMITGS